MTTSDYNFDDEGNPIATITFRQGAWTVRCGSDRIGRARSLMEATDLLYINGYKVYAYRRSDTASGKPKFTSRVLVFDYDKEHGDE